MTDKDNEFRIIRHLILNSKILFSVSILQIQIVMVVTVVSKQSVSTLFTMQK